MGIWRGSQIHFGESVPRNGSFGVNAQPFFQFDELHYTGLIESNQKGKGFEVFELQQISVYPQKGRSHSNGDPLVSVNERMVLRQALPERGSFVDGDCLVNSPIRGH